MRITEGLTRRFSALGKPLLLDGEAFTVAQLAALFRDHDDAIAAVDRARAGLAAAVERERVAALRAVHLTRALKTVVHAHFGDSPEAWADFGWEVPRKPGPRTPEAKARGAAKGRETRRARGTMGKKQRKKIRGW
jgi:hypothetical protein